jgi:16S rRNA (guanine527-N7)-methyltransferase
MSSCSPTLPTDVRTDVLERWLEALVATPGLTAIGDLARGRAMLVDDALKAAPLVRDADGAIVDVGSGTGSPGIPLALALPDREFVLLESQRRKCDFLHRTAADLPNVTVVWGRAEEQAIDEFGVALAKALAKPPVAAELCLPLVRPGGIAVLWVGENAEEDRVAAVAARVGGTLDRREDGLLVLRKLTQTPAGFPRRVGMAKKRPLA